VAEEESTPHIEGQNPNAQKKDLQTDLCSSRETNTFTAGYNTIAKSETASSTMPGSTLWMIPMSSFRMLMEGIHGHQDQDSAQRLRGFLQSALAGRICDHGVG
jgi:hypothetical protein